MDWLTAREAELLPAAREAELLPVPYFHVVFTMPAQLGRIAYQNKGVVYRTLFQAAAEALLTLGADPKRLGAKLGMIGVLHTWGSAMTHHPHLHAIVPGGGLSLDGKGWVASKYHNFLLPLRVLSRPFRRLMLERMRAAYDSEATPPPWRVCPQCGHTMTLVECFDAPPRHRGGDPPP
jgi:hypothetical protein